MNVLPCRVDGATAYVGGRGDRAAARLSGAAAGQRIELGIRPEFLRFSAHGFGLPVARPAHRRYRPRAASPASRSAGVPMAATCRMTSRSTGDEASVVLRPAPDPHLRRRPPRGGRPGRERPDGQAVNNRAWFLVLPVFADRGVLAPPAAHDGRELFGAGHLRQQPVLLERRRLVPGLLDPEGARRRASSRPCGATSCSRRSSSRSRSRSASWSRSPCRARAGRWPSAWC